MIEDISIPMLILSILAGYLLGIVSGLIPGIHTNNFALMLVALAPMLGDYGVSPLYAVVVILSNSITHTFHDVIPAVFLGAPNDDMALAVLPGHRLLLDGYGAEAIRLSAIGSAGSVAFSLILAIPLVNAFSRAYPIMQAYMGWILLGVSVLMIITETGEHVIGQGSLAHYRYKFYALVLFIISGLLGVFAFRTEHLMEPFIDLGSASILLPLLSGLFGASQLVISLFSGSHIPDHNISRMELSSRRIVRGIVTGSAAGSVVAWLPGISSAIATVLARLFIRSDFDTTDGLHDDRGYGDDDEEQMNSSKEFIVSVSGVNTSNAIFGLFALAAIGKTRSGAMVAVDKLVDAASFDTSMIILLLLVILVAALLSYFSTVAIGNNIHHLLSRINYSSLCIGVIVGLALMVLAFTGVFGLLVFLIATPIGMFAPFMNIRRTHAMGVILLPVILYFI
ncbi:MAG: tripartite tricarboxylate transporter permease [Euryarchaeota archaeon]|nr:tripartite tricarboxylate transporter permease [Euryarchaeota archaeon]